MTRIDDRFAALKAEGKKAFVADKIATYSQRKRMSKGDMFRFCEWFRFFEY